MTTNTDGTAAAEADGESPGAVTGPTTAPAWGIFFICAAILILIVAVVLAGLTQRGSSQSANRLVQYGVLPIVWGLLALGRRLRARDALKELEVDPREPIIYLRSFGDDLAPVPLSQTGKTIESQLIHKLRKHGPVLAIGTPAEKLPPLGAARLYVSHAEWQEVVKQLTSSAQLVVLRAGSTRGFFWELRHVRDELAPEKVVLFVPPGIDYDEFRERASAVLRTQLPEKLSGLQFISFTADWSPVALTTTGEFAARKSFTVRSSEFTVLGQRLSKRNPDTVASRRKLTDLLAGLQMRVVRPPPFRLTLWAVAVIALWIVCVALWPSRLLRLLLDVPLLYNNEGAQTAIASAIELIVVGIFAIAIAFYVYLWSPKRRTLASVALAALLLAHAAYVFARPHTYPAISRTSPPSLILPPVDTRSILPVVWEPFESPLRDFVISVPGKFAEMPFPPNEEIVRHVFQTTTTIGGQRVAFVVGRMDFPKNTLSSAQQENMDMVRDASIAQAHLTLVSEQPLKEGSGRELRYSSGEAGLTMIQRMQPVGDYLYSMAVSFEGKPDESIAARYFGSFRFTKPIVEAAATPVVAATPAARWSSPDKFFSIIPPAGWKEGEQEKSGSRQFYWVISEPPAAIVMFGNYNLVRLPKDLPAELVDQMEGAEHAVTPISKIQGSGWDGIRREYVDAGRFRKLMVAARNGTTVVTLMMSTQESSFETYRPTFESVVKSLKLGQ